MSLSSVFYTIEIICIPIELSSMWYLCQARIHVAYVLSLFDIHRKRLHCIFFFSVPLQNALQRVDAELKKDSLDPLGNRRQKRMELQHIDDFDCILCLKLLYDPVTTPCGHSFCRPCLRQAMDHGEWCYSFY